MPPSRISAACRRLPPALALLVHCFTAAAQDSGSIGIRLRLAPPPAVEWRGTLFEAGGDADLLAGELLVRCQGGQRFRLDAPHQLVRAGRQWVLDGASGEQVCSGRAQRFAFVARRSDAALMQGQADEFGVTFY